MTSENTTLTNSAKQIYTPTRQAAPLKLRVSEQDVLEEFHYEPITVAVGAQDHVFALHYFTPKRQWRISHIESGLGLVPLELKQFGRAVDVNRAGISGNTLLGYARRQLTEVIAEHGAEHFNAALSAQRVDPKSRPVPAPSRPTAQAEPSVAVASTEAPRTRSTPPASRSARPPSHNMATALGEGRLFYSVSEGGAVDPELEDYPFVVFKEAPSASWHVGDAWHTNAKGLSSEVYPLPVRLAAVGAISDAPGHLRAPFQDLLPAAQPSPGSDEFGGFSNLPTMVAACCLVSSNRVWEELSRDGGAPATGTPTGTVLKAAVRRTTMHREVMQIEDKEQINWDELATQFDAESSPVPRSLPEPRTSPVVVAEAAKDEAPAVEEDPVSNLVKPRPIDDDVLQVLRNSRFDDLALYLPQVQLQRDLYARVAAVLKELGGKWKGGKVSAHLFGSAIDRDAAEMAIGLGFFTSTKDLGFFPTPAALVDQMIEWAQIEPGMQTMEPEAGNGAIAQALARATGSKDLVRCYEILERNVATLQSLGFTDVHRANFLEIEPTPMFDRIVMNPPFAKYQDVAHVLHATRFLKPDGVIVACTSRSWLGNTHRAAEDFRSFVNQACGVTQEIPAGAFKESGTNVATAVITIEAQHLPWNNRPRERHAG